MKKIFLVLWIGGLSIAMHAQNFDWVAGIGGANFQAGYATATDVAGNIFVAGVFSNIGDFNPGPATFNLISNGGSDIFILKLDPSGNFLWAKAIGGLSSDDVESMVVDASGNVLVAGSISLVSGDSIDFDPGPGIFNLCACPGSSRAYLLKLNNAGNFIWAKIPGGHNVHSIFTDASNKIYLTGSFAAVMDFDPGAGVFNMTAVDYDIFVQKLDSSGNLLWVKSVSDSSSAYTISEGKSIVTDVSGNVFTTGYFMGTVDFDPGPGTNYLTSDGDEDVYVLKMDLNGNLLWARRVGSTGEDNGYSLCVTSSGKIAVTGFYNGTVDFNPGPSVYNLTSAGIKDAFVLNLDGAGQILWCRSIGGSNLDNGIGVKADLTGNIYTMGSFDGILDFDPGPGSFLMGNTGTQSFVQRLNSSGNFVSAFALSNGISARDFILNNNQNIFLTGSFTGTRDFDPGSSVFNLSSSGGSTDIFELKLNLCTPPSATITPVGPLTFCTGGSVLLNANTGTGLTYQWRKSNVNIPGATTSSYTAITGDNYTVAVSSGFCMTVSSIVSTTVQTPLSPIISAWGPTSFCAGGSVVLNGSLGGGYGYQWKINGTNITGATTGTYTASVGGSYTVTITNTCGNYTSNAIVVTVNANQSALISPAGSTTFCTGGFVTLNANTGTGLTYQWQKNAANISGATSSSYVATTTGSYTVAVTSTCGTATSAAISVTVSTTVPGTPGSITTTGGIVKVCPGNVRTYTINAVSGATSYTWTPCAGSTITSGQNTNSVTIQYNAGFPVSDTLRVVATNSCGNSAQRKLKISRNMPGTPAAITGNNFGVCNLNGIPFSVTNVAGMTYNWSFNTGTATVASGQGTSSITTNYGVGFVSGSLSVTAGNGCGVSAARLKTIYAKPATPVSITGATSVCLNQQNVPYSIAPLANVTNYTWTGPTGSHISVGSTTSAGTTLITTSAAVSVDFATTAGAIKVRGNNACASGSYKTLSVAIVCREGDFSEAYVETHIYPNPASTNFIIETDDTSTLFDLEVYDAYGRLVFSEASLNSGYKVNANGWADGLYSVVVRKGNNMTNLKLVIQGLE